MAETALRSALLAAGGRPLDDRPSLRDALVAAGGRPLAEPEAPSVRSALIAAGGRPLDPGLADSLTRVGRWDQEPERTTGERALEGVGAALKTAAAPFGGALVGAVQEAINAPESEDLSERVTRSIPRAIAKVGEGYKRAAGLLPSWAYKPFDFMVNAAQDVANLAYAPATMALEGASTAAKDLGAMSGQMMAPPYQYKPDPLRPPEADAQLQAIAYAGLRPWQEFAGGLVGSVTGQVINPQVSVALSEGRFEDAKRLMQEGVENLPNELYERPVSTLLGPSQVALGLMRGGGRLAAKTGIPGVARAGKAVAEFKPAQTVVEAIDRRLADAVVNEPTSATARAADFLGYRTEPAKVIPGEWQEAKATAAQRNIDPLAARENALRQSVEQHLASPTNPEGLTPQELIGVMTGETEQGSLHRVMQANANATSANLRSVPVKSKEWADIAAATDTQAKRDALLKTIVEDRFEPKAQLDPAGQLRYAKQRALFEDPQFQWFRNLVIEGGIKMADLKGLAPETQLRNMGTYVARMLEDDLDRLRSGSWLKRGEFTGKASKQAEAGRLYAKNTPEEFYIGDDKVLQAVTDPVDVVMATAYRVATEVAILEARSELASTLRSQGYFIPKAAYGQAPKGFTTLPEALVARPWGEAVPQDAKLLFHKGIGHTSDKEFLQLFGPLSDGYVRRDVADVLLHGNAQMQALPELMKQWKWLHTIANVGQYQLWNHLDDMNRIWRSTKKSWLVGEGRKQYAEASRDWTMHENGGDVPMVKEFLANGGAGGGWTESLGIKSGASVDAIRAAREAKRVKAEWRKAGLDPATATRKQVRDVAGSKVFSSGDVWKLWQKSIENGKPMSFIDLLGKVPEKGGAFVDALNRWSGSLEEFRRYHVYRMSRKEGMAPAAAMRRVNDLLFDYSDKSPMLQMLSGRWRINPDDPRGVPTIKNAVNTLSGFLVNPFLTFPTKLTQWAAKTVYEEPALTVMANALNRGFEAASMAMQFDDRFNEDRKAQREWAIREANPLYAGQYKTLGRAGGVELAMPRRMMGYPSVMQAQDIIGIGAGPAEQVVFALLGRDAYGNEVKDKNAPEWKQAVQQAGGLASAVLPGVVLRGYKAFLAAKAQATGEREFSPGTKRELTAFDIAAPLPARIQGFKIGDFKNRVDNLFRALQNETLVQADKNIKAYNKIGNSSKVKAAVQDRDRKLKELREARKLVDQGIRAFNVRYGVLE